VSSASSACHFLQCQLLICWTELLVNWCRVDYHRHTHQQELRSQQLQTTCTDEVNSDGLVNLVTNADLLSMLVDNRLSMVWLCVSSVLLNVIIQEHSVISGTICCQFNDSVACWTRPSFVRTEDNSSVNSNSGHLKLTCAVSPVVFFSFACGI
jgi:hypothetical protein